MSVWATTLALDEDRAPLVYQQSHVLPSADGPRGGELSLAGLPGHLTRDGHDDGDPDVWWPYLRVSLRSPIPGEDTVVLDLDQVDALLVELVDWRRHVDESRR